MLQFQARNRRKYQEWLLFCCYVLLFLVIICFHEPWFDEIQAWQIAKCASIKDILFLVPHYEGHPPLWHLLLIVPAKLGIPVEVGLKFVSCLIYAAVVWLLLFQAPFAKWIRFLLPLNFFLFYQYGVVSRPYGMMALAFFLVAFTFSERDLHPWRFFLALYFLCQTNVYGIAIAGGFALAWLVDIWRERGGCFQKVFWKDQRIKALSTLFLLTLFLLGMLLPREDTRVSALVFRPVSCPLGDRLLYSCLGMIGDTLIGNILPDTGLSYAKISKPELLLGAVVGGIVLFAILMISSRKNLKFFFLPYGFFALFSCFVYFYGHHMGILFLMIVSWLWMAFQDEERFYLAKKLWKNLKLSSKDRGTLCKAGKLLLLFVLLIPTWWTGMASFHDVMHPYYFARETAAFLKEKGLQDARIMIGWTEDENPMYEDPYERMNTSHYTHIISVLGYFDRNIFCNVNEGRNDRGYEEQRIASASENRETLKKWSLMGYPEVILGDFRLEEVYGDEISMRDYAPVYEMISRGPSIWKANFSGRGMRNYDYIYVRRDLLEQYGLQEIPSDFYVSPGVE